MSAIGIGLSSDFLGAVELQRVEEYKFCRKRRIGFRFICACIALILATERAKADEPITAGTLLAWGVALLLGGTAVAVVVKKHSKVKVRAKADKITDINVQVETGDDQGSVPPKGDINNGVRTNDTNFKIITTPTMITTTMNAGGEGNAINAGLEPVSYFSSVETTLAITPLSTYDELGINLNVGNSIASITQTTPVIFGEAGYNFTAEIVTSSGTVLSTLIDQTFQISGTNSQTVDSAGLNESVFVTSAELSALGIGPLDNLNVLVSYAAFGSAIPEPSTWVLVIAGFAGLGLTGYRSKRRKA